jgi:hypothetical protein
MVSPLRWISPRASNIPDRGPSKSSWKVQFNAIGWSRGRQPLRSLHAVSCHFSAICTRLAATLVRFARGWPPHGTICTRLAATYVLFAWGWPPSWYDLHAAGRHPWCTLHAMQWLCPGRFDRDWPPTLQRLNMLKAVHWKAASKIYNTGTLRKNV